MATSYHKGPPTPITYAQSGKTADILPMKPGEGAHTRTGVHAAGTRGMCVCVSVCISVLILCPDHPKQTGG